MLSDHLRRYARACWEVVRPDLGKLARSPRGNWTGSPGIPGFSWN